MNGTAVVTDDINFAIAEGKVVRSVGKGVTSMTVAVGKPVIPDKPAANGRRRAFLPHRRQQRPSAKQPRS